ncbi:MAG TPA: 50S ribosomal protein L35 [Lamprocystis sp. (in: g-proteobacteria)]|nr:50S ribosomal protein L35 [Lamprocystis sp. (in: g-proteobacteria)]
MPKIRTNRGAAKRLKRTANGVKCYSSFRRHILTKKSTKRKRHLRAARMVHSSDLKSALRMIPYC